MSPTGRQLSKGSWPGLLTEVSFQMNSMVNSTTRISPNLLNFGREPASPLDAWCNHLGEGERNSQGEYLETLRRKRVELRDIAFENSRKISQRPGIATMRTRQRAASERVTW